MASRRRRCAGQYWRFRQETPIIICSRLLQVATTVVLRFPIFEADDLVKRVGACRFIRALPVGYLFNTMLMSKHAAAQMMAPPMTATRAARQAATIRRGGVP